MTATLDTTGFMPITAEFNGTPLTIIERDGHKWLTADQVGCALGYAEAITRISVMKLFSRHQDEFTELETCVVKLTTGCRGEQNTRIFSATGCIKLGFFANTKRAKKFRAWASEVLAGHGQTQQGRDDTLRTQNAQLQTKVAQLQAVALGANPRWAALARYRAMGLSRVEMAKLLDTNVNAIKNSLAAIKCAGLILAEPLKPVASVALHVKTASTSTQTTLFAEVA